MQRARPMTLAETFRADALREIEGRIDRLRLALTYAEALGLPQVDPQDIVIANREAQLAIFRQSGQPLEGHVLVTVQVARHGLGGVVSFNLERGLVFSQDGSVRDATDQELLGSAG
jgi:hypothetical protein